MLNIDKSTLALKVYHTSSKWLLPSLGLSGISYKYNLKIEKPIYMSSAVLVGYHSYFSVSSVITDYIKPVSMNNVARLINAKSHLVATLGIIHYIYKQNKEL